MKVDNGSESSASYDASPSFDPSDPKVLADLLTCPPEQNNCSPTSTTQFNERTMVTKHARGGIWEGQITRVPHRRYLEVMPFVNMPTLVAILMVTILMVVPTAMAINEARVVATILKIRVQMHVT